MANSDLLTERIKGVRKSILDHGNADTLLRRNFRKLKNWGASFCLPNIQFSFGIAGVLVLLSFLLSSFGQITTDDQFLISSLTTLWQVQTGIAGVALPFLLFVIEFSKEQTYATLRSSEVLIHKTLIFPVTASALAITLKMGTDVLWGARWSTYYVNLILFGMTVAGTLYSFTVAMILMFNRHKMQKEAEQLLTLRVGADLDRTIEIRLGRNILNTEIKDWSVEYSPFRSDRAGEMNYISLDLAKEGEVVEVDIGRFKAFVESLRNQRLVTPMLTAQTLSQEGNDQADIFLFSTFGDQIEGKRRTVLLLKKNVFGEINAAQESMALQHIFTVSPVNESEAERVRYELTMLRNGIIDAIRHGHTDVVLEGLKTYKGLTEVFLDKLRPFGRYSREQVQEEVLNQWSEVKWIRQDYEEILREAFDSKKEEMISHLLFFPLSVAELSLKNGDYYLFHHFTYWVPEFAYHLSSRFEDQVLRDSIIDRLWKYLREFSDFYIGHFMNEISEEEDFTSTKEISIGIILIFNNLLKSTIDRRDIESFKTFRKGLSRSFQHIAMDIENSTIQQIEWQLEHTDPQSEQWSRLNKELRKVRNESDLMETITERRQQLLFGLEAWILREYFVGRINVTEFSKWHREVGNFGNLDELLILLIGCLEREHRDTFRWSWWITEEHEEMTGFQIDFDTYLRRLFCLRAIEAVKEVPPETRRTIKLSLLPREKKYILDQLSETLKEIASKQEWRPLVGQEELQLLPDVQWLISELSQKLKDKEIALLIRAPIDPNRITTFQEELIKSWKEHGIARAIFNRYGNIDTSEMSPANPAFYGMRTLLSKEVFVAGNPTTGSLGQEVGKVVGRDENNRILSDFFGKLSFFTPEPVPLDQILSTIDSMLTKIRENGHRPIILILNSWDAKRAMETSQSFLPSTPPGPSWLFGWYKNNIAVLHIYSMLRDSIVVADLRTLGVWVQYNPGQIIPEGEAINDVFNFLLQLVDENYARRLLMENPGLKMNPQTGTEQPEPEAVLRLCQQVHFHLFQQFEYSVINPEAGAKITLVSD